MAANTTDPKTLTDALVTLLRAALVGTSKPAQAVIDYWDNNLQGQGPVVMVLGAGDDPTLAHLGDPNPDTWFYIEIQAWVPYSGGGWTPSLSEAARTAIKKKIKDCVLDNRAKSYNATVPWDVLTFAGRSTTQDIEDVGGNPYTVESTPLRARIAHG